MMDLQKYSYIPGWLPLVIAAIYLCGYISITAFVGQHGFGPVELLNPKILITSFVLILLLLISMGFAWGAARLTDDTMRGKIAASVVYYISFYWMLGHYIFVERGSWSFEWYWWILLVAAIGLLLIADNAVRLNRNHSSNIRLIIASLVTAAYITLNYKSSYIYWLLFLHLQSNLIVFGIMKQIETNTLNSKRKIKVIDDIMALAVIAVITIGGYGTLVYDQVKREYGGGQKAKVVICSSLDVDMKKVINSTDTLDLIFEDGTNYYIANKNRYFTLRKANAILVNYIK